MSTGRRRNLLRGWYPGYNDTILQEKDIKSYLRHTDGSQLTITSRPGLTVLAIPRNAEPSALFLRANLHDQYKRRLSPPPPDKLKPPQPLPQIGNKSRKRKGDCEWRGLRYGWPSGVHFPDGLTDSVNRTIDDLPSRTPLLSTAPESHNHHKLTPQVGSKSRKRKDKIQTEKSWVWMDARISSSKQIWRRVWP